MSKFSIIIPVYNVAPYLRECLDSVLAQTCTDWEAICVDDGSTDGSGEILDEYREKVGEVEKVGGGGRRMVVIHQQNAGVSAARNAALEVAQGEWLCFVDADDYIRNDYLEKFLASEEKYDVNFLNLQFVYSDGLKIDRKMPSVKCSALAEGSSALLNLIVNGGDGFEAFGWTWDKIVRAKIIKEQKVRFVEGISYFEDQLFAFDFFKHVNSFQILPSPVYSYRRKKGGLSDQEDNDCSLARLIRCFIMRARETKYSVLRALALKQIQYLIRKSENGNSDSSLELARIVSEVNTAFPNAIGRGSCQGRVFRAIGWMPVSIRIRLIAFVIALERLKLRSRKFIAESD